MVSWFVGMFAYKSLSYHLLIFYLFCDLIIWWHPKVTAADCWYNNHNFKEHSHVQTDEPCLNCTCNKGVLLCYLRVCPKLPNPPPPGCVLVHRYKACCPELICSDFYDGSNSLEARSDVTNELDLDANDLSVYSNACVFNGTIYGSGSAMHSSSLCEFCYCLAGKQVCVKPKCLMTIEGCTPVFQDNSCCPIRYNCANNSSGSISSTTPKTRNQGDCIIDGLHYLEGKQVIGTLSHTACDNCYCLKGTVKCEPLSCAPPLLGCTPIIKSGECCAASYNCNGTFEIEAKPNYGLFPTISKEYSKFQKQVQNLPIGKKNDVVTILAETMQDSKVLHQRSPDSSYGTTRHFSGVDFATSSTKKLPLTTEKMYNPMNEKKHEENTESSELLNIFSIVNSLLEGFGEDDSSTSEPHELVATTVMEEKSESTTVISDQNTDSTIFTTTATGTDASSDLYPVTVRTVIKSTDCNENVEQIIEKVDFDTTVLPSMETTLLTTEIAEDLSINKDVVLRKKNGSNISALDIETILNISKQKNGERNDYDYNEAPPLPNLNIIPFVEADAVDPTKETPKDSLEDRSTESKIEPISSGYNINLFSPPTKTEGGFVPKEPPLLSPFRNTFSKIPPPSVNKIAELSSSANCMVDKRLIEHGTLVTSDVPCLTCTCLYGNVMCQKPNCPPPRPGCVEEAAGDLSPLEPCCPNYVCDKSIDRQDLLPQIVTVADGIIPSGPFNDVIKTEPAPDLESLIDDMKSLQETSTSDTVDIVNYSTEESALESTTNAPSGNFAFDDIWKLFFAENNSLKNTPNTDKPLPLTRLKPNKNRIEINEKKKFVAQTPLNHNNNNNNTNNSKDTITKVMMTSGTLKVAGCNIYGRMYRVGRIISELSGPCLECKCTEDGVQCISLKC